MAPLIPCAPIPTSVQIMLELRGIRRHDSTPTSTSPTTIYPYTANEKPDSSFTTIRALSEAPFSSTYTDPPDFLVSGEEFFEDNPLVAATLNTATQRKYSVALQNFRLSQPFSDTTPLSLDQRLAIYIQEEFLENALPGHRQEMSNLVCMLLIMYPDVKPSLGIARRCIAGWRTLKPAQASAPLTKQMVLAFAYQMLSSQRAESATALILSFFACLRVSEALQLCWNDVALPGDVRLSAYGPNVAGLNIRDAKTSRYTGHLQFVQITDQLATVYLRMCATYVRSTNIDSKVAAVSYHTYTRDLKRAANAFGFHRARFTTHSARIGKATEDYILGIPVDQIAMNGRWKTLKSLRYYLDNGKAWILDNSISPSNQTQLRQAAHRLSEIVTAAR